MSKRDLSKMRLARSPVVEGISERNLWAAVMTTILEDATSVIKSMSSDVEKFGCTTQFKDWRLKSILRELESEWMEVVGGFCEIHPDHLYRHIQRLEKEHGINIRVVLNEEEWLLNSKNKGRKV